MSNAVLEKCFPGVCKIIWEDNILKVKNEIIDWRDEKDSILDAITNNLTIIAKNNTLSETNSADDIICYYCDEETASKVLSELPTEYADKTAVSNTTQKEYVDDDRINKDIDEPTEISIGELFKIKLNLPSYQRPYRWKKKNIEFFWKGIKDSEIPYDFGIIVLLKNNDCNDIVYDIVDGQQRIVTLSLMLRSLSSSIADSFINNATLQGKESEKHIGYNLQWFRRQAEKIENKQEMIDKIVNGYLDIIVMNNLEEALKFFDRMNTSGVDLTATDILKSHHLLPLSDKDFTLSDRVKKRWRGKGFIPDSALDDPTKFKNEIVKKWESYDPGLLNKYLASVCALRMMAKGLYPYNMNEIWDIEQFRRGNKTNAEYTGLDCPIPDGEFFFWYVFNMFEKCTIEENNCEKYDHHAAYLRQLLTKTRAQEFFDILVVYIHEKFPMETTNPNFNKLLDLIFSWLIGICLYYYSLVQFPTIRNDALKDGSLFNAIVVSKSLEDCFDCYCENPLEVLDREGLGDYVAGNNNYLIRRELRRIHG